MHLALIITIAYVLDLIFGDPRWFPHPVKGIGWLIKESERFLRGQVKNERIAGIILGVFIISIVWGTSFIIIHQANNFNPYLGAGISIFFIYTCLAVKDLKVEAMAVYRSLNKRDTILARKNLSLIVGRDTCSLGPQAITRATVETVSENIVDGIFSPLFYAFLGGAPLALAYKAINTLDSMVGYKNKNYRNFGWFSAKIDDWANFISARLTLIILPIASLLSGKNWLNSFKLTLRDSRKSLSPNSGLPQAAVAGALGIQLGGLSFYNSLPVSKPLIGDKINSLNLSHIRESIKLSYLSSLLALVLGVVLVIIIK
jgi:adenosylcobinamide-phosphate synthase